MYYCDECGATLPRRHSFRCSRNPERRRATALEAQRRREIGAYQRGYEDGRAAVVAELAAEMARS